MGPIWLSWISYFSHIGARTTSQPVFFNKFNYCLKFSLFHYVSSEIIKRNLTRSVNASAAVRDTNSM